MQFFFANIGYLILILYLYTLIPLLREAKINKSSYVMVIFLSMLEMAAWANTVWLDRKELMIVHLLIFTFLVISDFAFNVPPKILGKSIMFLCGAMVLTDTFFFIYGWHPFYQHSIINLLFISMCVITRIACNNDRQKKEIKDGNSNGNLYAMVKKAYSDLVKAH